MTHNSLTVTDNRTGKNGKLPSIILGGPLAGDVFHLKLEAKDETPNSIVESIYLNGDLSVADSLWQLTFNAVHWYWLILELVKHVVDSVRDISGRRAPESTLVRASRVAELRELPHRLIHLIGITP